ncbi:MAG: ethanolamine utilization protein EutA, partial [Pseudomonadota bacterium]
SLDSTDEMWQSAFNLAAHRQLGACIQLIDLNTTTSLHALGIIKLLALKIKHHYALSGYSDTQALLILVEENIGKVLGNYISDWGQSMQNLIVIDEVPHRNAHFVNVGRLHQQMVPVSFFGMH